MEVKVMIKTASFCVLCILCVFLSSCVSKGNYTALETILKNTEAQLREKNEAFWDLQDRQDELNNENTQLLGNLGELEYNLDQAESEIQNKQGSIWELTENLGMAQSVIGEQEIAMGELRANLGEVEFAVQQKDSTIGRLSLDLGEVHEMVREKNYTISELDRTRREIELSLKEQIAQRDVKIEEIEGKLKVTFIDKILFDSGSTRIKDKGQEVLLTLAESLIASTNNTIVVEGHTDDVDIGWPLRERFPSNWELSTARAASVVRFLQEQANIKPERLTATGYSFHRPIAANDTIESRSQNRRIEIILIPMR